MTDLLLSIWQAHPKLCIAIGLVVAFFICLACIGVALEESDTESES